MGEVVTRLPVLGPVGLALRDRDLRPCRSSSKQFPSSLAFNSESLEIYGTIFLCLF